MRIALPLTRRSPSPAHLSLPAALALWRSRRALAALSPDQLRDVGLSARDAAAEAARAPWDAPAAWKN